MRRSRSRRTFGSASLTLLVLAGGLLAQCRRAPDAGTLDRLSQKRLQHEALWNDFQDSVRSDPLLEDVLGDEGQVMVGIRSPLLQRIGQEVARSYLDRVELDLPLRTRVTANGQINVKTKLGRMTAGNWKVRVLIERVTGVLRAATPVVSLPAPDRLALSVPVTLEQGQGTAAVHFQWDSAGLANAVCADFEVQRTIQGRVLPDAYILKGGLVLAATDDAVLARPTLQDARFRLRFDLTADSWARVEAALQEQAAPGKCGLAMKAISSEDILAKLRAILAKGFDVTLPKSLLRTFSLPARLQRSVDVEGRQFALAVKPHALRAAHDVLWSSAEVQVTKKAK